jgi:hypothetical protein
MVKESQRLIEEFTEPRQMLVCLSLPQLWERHTGIPTHQPPSLSLLSMRVIYSSRVGDWK